MQTIYSTHKTVQENKKERMKEKNNKMNERKKRWKLKKEMEFNGEIAFSNGDSCYKGIFCHFNKDMNPVRDQVLAERWIGVQIHTT